MSKTFKGASRADAQSIDPLDLCLIGGKALPKEEQGPLDTEWDPLHQLHAHDLLKPLDPIDVESVFQHGVIVPIEVVRGVNDVPIVSLGRGRVRKARLANIRRKTQKLPPIAVKFTVVRITDNVQMLSRMIDENLRRKSVSVLDRIQLAKQLLLAGASEEWVANKFEITKQRLDQWLGFADHATPNVLAALRQDRLSPSSAIVLAEIEDPDEMDKKLAELLTSPKPTARAARQLQRSTRGKEAVSRPRLPDQKKLLSRVDRLSRGNEWMQGVQAALRWVIGEKVHKDLVKLLAEETTENNEEG